MKSQTGLFSCQKFTLPPKVSHQMLTRCQLLSATQTKTNNDNDDNQNDADDGNKLSGIAQLSFSVMLIKNT